MSILVPVSGGPDSLYALKKAVEYGKGVHAFLMEHSCGDERINSGAWAPGARVGHRGMAAAAAHFVDYFKESIIKVHRYTVHVPYLHWEQGEYTGEYNQLRYVEYYFIAPIVNILLDNLDITAISMGVCREEFDMVEDISQHEDYRYDAQTLGAAYRALLNGREVDRFFLTLPAPSKQDIRDYVGEYFWGVSVSCHMPTNNNQGVCGKCVKCEARATTEYRGNAGTWSGPEAKGEQ